MEAGWIRAFRIQRSMSLGIANHTRNPTAGATGSSHPESLCLSEELHQGLGQTSEALIAWEAKDSAPILSLGWVPLHITVLINFGRLKQEGLTTSVRSSAGL